MVYDHFTGVCQFVKKKRFCWPRTVIVKMSVFVTTTSPVTGKQEWVLQDDNYDYQQEVARAAYADMLHDTERNRKYDQALKSAIDNMHARGKQANVLDIGTGTGLLSMMAVRNGADTVTACEAFTPMATCANKVMSENGCREKIHLIPKRSNEITVGPGCDLEKRANILVTEVFDTELIGEGAIPTFRHAHEKLLEKDCIVVPSAANMYIQVVHSDLARNWKGFGSVTMPNGDDILPPVELTNCPGSVSVHDLQMDQIRTDWIQPLTEPTKVFHFDYSGKSPIEANEHGTEKLIAIDRGRCDAVLMWWDLQMDTEGDIMLSCAPGWAQPTKQQPQWRDHWMQAIYYPQTRLQLDKGQPFTVHSYHDEYSLWFDVTTSDDRGDVGAPACRCGAHMVCSWSRVGMMNDRVRNDAYIRALQQVVTEETVCMTISDGSLLPVMVAKLGAKQVFALENQPMSRQMVECYIKENHIDDRVKLISKYCQDLTDDDFGKQKINLLIGEPFFFTTTLPWHNMLFWYCRTEIQDLLANNCVVLPRLAAVRAIAVDFEHLWKIRAPVGNCEGFNLQQFDRMIEAASTSADTYLEAQPLWEYPGKPLSDQFDILTLDFSRPLSSIKVIEREGFIELWTSGTCNGVAVWMDYYLDQSNSIQTGLLQPPTIGESLVWDIHTRQAVHLFQKPTAISVDGQRKWRLKHKVVFKPKTGDLDFKFEVVN